MIIFLSLLTIAFVLFVSVGLGYNMGLNAAEKRSDHNHIWDPWQDGEYKVIEIANKKEYNLVKATQTRACLDCGLKERRFL